VSYEWLGTVALLTLGIGPGFAGLVMARMGPGAPGGRRGDSLRRLAGAPKEGHGEEAEATGEIMVIPAPTIWPFVLSLGFAIALTGLVFGLWLVVIGGSLAVTGLSGWLASVYRETIVRQALTGGGGPAGGPGH
jgi:ribose/xylose/arabinose/galactoside ABC-type transport system permease subunit